MVQASEIHNPPCRRQSRQRTFRRGNRGFRRAREMRAAMTDVPGGFLSYGLSWCGVRSTSPRCCLGLSAMRHPVQLQYDCLFNHPAGNYNFKLSSWLNMLKYNFSEIMRESDRNEYLRDKHQVVTVPTIVTYLHQMHETVLQQVDV